jgi:exodeoxyribonuclease V alpha subunit
MTESIGQLQRLRQQRLLNDLDLQFASLMCRLADGGSPELALAAALVSNGTGSGHVCVDLRAHSGRPLGDGKDCMAPEFDAWVKSLRGSPVVGCPGDFRPLVLSEQGLLYLYRYWRYERTLADELLARSRTADFPVQEPPLGPLLERLFPATGLPGPDGQRLAAATSLMRRLSVISGGPGTGKTRTVVRILVLLLEQAGDRPLDIALAAPTGKAAARLQQSVRQAKQQLPLPAGLLERIPEQATTLHRLLGSRPDSMRLRYDRDNPLPLDVLVLDEASMVDVAMMAKLLVALPQKARLILLGDRDQLASVEAGSVLGDICAPATGPSADFARTLAQLTGEPVPAGDAAADSPLADSVVLLQHSFRFAADSGIGRLADAVKLGDEQRCLALLQDDEPADVALLGAQVEAADLAAEGYRAYLQLVALHAAPELVFEAFDRFRLLCALRLGPSGVEGLNQAVERALDAVGLVDPGRRWYPGRPVIISRNDHNLRLYNGDIGIVLAEPAGDPRVCFPAADGSVRRIAPARLPQHDTAYALTVHKSQGSEFDRVLLVLPEQDSQLLSRELVYTALTRAKSIFQVKTSPRVLSAALARQPRRASGLRAALWRQRP